MERCSIVYEISPGVEDTAANVRCENGTCPVEGLGDGIFMRRPNPNPEMDEIFVRSNIFAIQSTCVSLQRPRERVQRVGL